MNKIFNMCVFFIFITSYINLYTLIVSFPLLFLYFFDFVKFDKYSFLVKNILMKSISFMAKNILFENVFVNSNEIFKQFLNEKNVKNIIISSHPTELDFLIGIIFFSSFSTMFDKNICLAKKDIGYSLPSIGFFGLFTKDIFLHRNIEIDMGKLNKQIDFNNVLLYPEGTCFTLDKKKLSDNYCKKNNLIKYNYHLYPRITGIELIVRNNPSIKYIIDLTILYDTIGKNDYGKCFSIKNYLLGKTIFPNKVFINIKFYKIIPNKLNDKFIENIYLTKDNFIEKFDMNCNNFVPIKYNYFENFIYFSLMNLLSVVSMYLCYKFIFIRYLYLIQILIFYFYYVLFV